MSVVVDDLADRTASESLFEQLKLGLGAGFVRALQAPATEAGELVLGCVALDPRWDRHLHTRADYYAQLLLATGVDVATVRALVDAQGDHAGEPDDRRGVAL